MADSWQQLYTSLPPPPSEEELLLGLQGGPMIGVVPNPVPARLPRKVASQSVTVSTRTPGTTSTPYPNNPFEENDSAYKEQLRGIQRLEDEVAAYKARPAAPDLTALAALTDAWSGSNFARAYKAPESQEDRQKVLIALEDKLQQRRADVSKPELAIYKAQLQQYQQALRDAARDTKVANAFNFRDQMYEQRNEDMAHRQVVQNIKKDPTTAKALVQYNNLSNALDIVDKSEKLTPQQIHEFQQAVRANLGIRGTSGVGEREATYINSLGMNAANIQQFITGEPAELAKDDKLMQHLRDLARIEKQNIRNQAKTRIDFLSDGYGHVYEKRPDLRRSLQQMVKAGSSQFDKDTPTGIPAGAASTAGMVTVTNGKETFQIPEADVAGAEKDGFRRAR